MNAISVKNPKRKTLTLKLPMDERRDQVIREQAIWMVWRQGGDAPKRIYTEPRLACRHAKDLTREYGVPFHVLRSWRVFECADAFDELAEAGNAMR